MLCPTRLRTAALLGLSLAFSLAVFPLLFPYMAGIVITDMAALAFMKRQDENPRARSLCLAFSVVKNLGCIVLVGTIMQESRLAPEALLGLYVVALSAMGCVLETYRRRIPHEASLAGFALYCFYFPRLAAGPLASYRELAPALESPDTSPAEIAKGLGVFIQGAVKFRILGQSLHVFYGALRAIPPGDASVLGAWVTVFVLILSIYYRFSGCVDMARGIGRMMGIPLPENFRYPFQRTSVTDFFSRFNCSLTRYVSDALGSRFAQDAHFAASAVGLLVLSVGTGFWFGFSAGRLAWGVYLGLFLIMERHLYPELLEKAPAVLRRVYALIVVFLSFTLFDAANIGSGLRTAGQMFGLAGLPLYTDYMRYIFDANRLLFIVSVFFAIGVHGHLFSFLRRRTPVLYSALAAAINLLLLVIFTAFSI